MTGGSGKSAGNNPLPEPVMVNDPAVRGTVDLHMHSTASDGSRTPEQVVEAAARVGLTAIALTDHDTLEGVAPARAAGERLGVRVVAGVELSATDGTREVHILALHITRAEPIEEQLRSFRRTRRERAERIVERLNALGVPVTLESVLSIAGSGALGRPHIARALVEGGWAADHRDAFDRYLGNGRPAFVPKHRLTVTEAMELAHTAGGIAVLAHPGQDGSRNIVEQLVKLGLDGVEVLHPSHSKDDIMRMHALADHFRLVPSGGSDWHGAPPGTGPGGGQRVIGCMRVPAVWLEQQDARVAWRARQVA